MRHLGPNERGAALVTVMLMMVIMFILVTVMLTRTSGELVIAGLHRDSTQAFENAQAGLEEAVRRIRANNPFLVPFAGSSSEGINVRVVHQVVGAGAAILEIQSDATVGLARRRLSLLVLQIVEEQLPDILFSKQLSLSGSVSVSGDIYSQQFAQVRHLPTKPDGGRPLFYAGWRISKLSGGSPNYSVPHCYQQPCNDPDGVNLNWFPGTRRAEYEDIPLNDGRKLKDVLDFSCADIPTEKIGVAHGWLPTDKRHDKAPPTPNNLLQALPNTVARYGCFGAGDGPADGLPYTWIRETFTATDNFTGGNTPEAVWFRVISLEKWLAKYYEINDQFQLVKKEPLKSTPTLGAVPPPPQFDALKRNVERTITGNIAAGDLGTCGNPDTVNGTCGANSIRRVVLLANKDDWIINQQCPSNNPCHGSLLVDGNLKVTGNMTYFGTVIVKGVVEITGTMTVYGGILGEIRLEGNGTATVRAGTLENTVPIGRATVERRAWFER